MEKIPGWRKDKGFKYFWNSNISPLSMIYIVWNENPNSKMYGKIYSRRTSKLGKKYNKKYFKTEKQALNYAVKYMKAHPRG